MEITDFSLSPSIINQYMSELRDVNVQTDMLRFRRNLERIGELMAYEISKKLNYHTVEVQTPLDKANCQMVDNNIVVATILRAGLPFHQGFLNVFDHAQNAFVSAYRKYREKVYNEKDNFDVFIEYIASPRLDGKTLIIVDPMLATGASMELSYRALLTKGEPAHIHVASVIASQVAVDYVKQHLPEEKTSMWLGAVDQHINDHSYIVPGLGDAGDLAYGIKE